MTQSIVFAWRVWLDRYAESLIRRAFARLVELGITLPTKRALHVFP